MYSIQCRPGAKIYYSFNQKVLDSDVQICYNKVIKEQEIQINGYYR